MLRHLTILLGILAVCMPAAHAAEVQFIGGLNILTATEQCTVARVTGNYTARFRPAGIGSNGTNSDFNLYRPDFAEGHRLLSASFDDTFKDVQAVIVGGGSGAFSGAKIMFSKQSVVKPSSKFVTIEGSIQTFGNDVGCEVSFIYGGARNYDFD